jgi:hypothetical protein
MMTSFIRTLLTIFSLLILQACSKDLSRSQAEEIINDKPAFRLSYTLKLALLGRGDQYLKTERMIRELANDGYVSIKTTDWKRGQEGYAGQIAINNHSYLSITPEERLIPLISDQEDSKRIGLIRIPTGERMVDQITGISKINETTALVKYKPKLVLNEIGEIYLKHFPEFVQPELNYSEEQSVVFRMNDDGWKLETTQY